MNKTFTTSPITFGTTLVFHKSIEEITRGRSEECFMIGTLPEWVQNGTERRGCEGRGWEGGFFPFVLVLKHSFQPRGPTHRYFFFL